MGDAAMHAEMPAERANAHVYQRPDRYVVESIVPLMPGGPQTNGGFLTTLPLTVTDEELGRAIRSALRDRQPAPPAPPPGGKPVARLWQAAGVRNRSAFMNGTLLCCVAWNGDAGAASGFQVIATWSDAYNGWQDREPDPALAHDASASDRWIGRAARTALAAGTAWTR